LRPGIRSVYTLTLLRRAEEGIQSMAREDNLYELPEGLPIPVDDGASDHLPGTRLPSVPLRSTAGTVVKLVSLTGRTVVYCYPRMGRPDEEMPQDWDEIPGARGCTPQSCAFRDHHAELRSLGARVFGLSAQGTEYQREAAQRLRLPFELLSDQELAFAKALGLPVFEAEGMTLLKRLTLVVNDGRIEKVFYPVFPPNENAEEVIEWLSQNPLEAVRTPR
jgi:peroxiredoxin